jgi:hypothetical protein
MRLRSRVSTKIDGEVRHCGHSIQQQRTIIAHHAEEITFTLKDEAAREPAGKVLPVDVEVDLSRGDAYLYVAAWDVTSKRLGTLEIPYHADLAKTGQSSHASK